MLAEQYPYYLAGSPERSGDDLAVTDKYTDEVVTHVALADGDAIERAIDAAERAAHAMMRFPAHARREVLAHRASRFAERADELAEVLCIEAGKPIRDSRGEVARLVDTFRIASEEAGRTYGEVLPMDISARAVAYTGMWKRVPIGPCSFITPFNFPLNLVAHKVAPAIAAGCPFVLKPSSLTPIGALIVGEVLPGGPGDAAGLLVGDELLQISTLPVQTGLPDFVGSVLWSLIPGDQIVYLINRGGQSIEYPVLIGARRLTSYHGHTL